MRSSDASGAGAEGFGVGQGETGKVEAAGIKTGFRFDIGGRISPITVAVGLTAFLAATLFVIFDAARTLEDARGQLRLIGKAVATDLATMPAALALQSLDQLAKTYSEAVEAEVLAGAWIEAAPLVSYRFRADVIGVVQLRQDTANVLGGMLPRGGGAYLAAMLIAILSLRRRSSSWPVPADGERSIESLVAAIPHGVACWSRNGELIACNTRYRSSIGAETTQPIAYGEAVKRLIGTGYMKMISDGEDNRVLELHRADGSCFLVDERPFGQDGFVTLVSDVTERKRADTLLANIREEQRLLARRYHEEKLKAEAASRSKTNFLAHLSHDIRTPINHIIGFADLIRHQAYGPVGDTRYLEYIQNIKSSGELLLDSFATILDLAELESGQKVLRDEALNVDELVASVATRFKPQALRAGVRFEIGADCGAALTGDRFCLTRMISNILENAIRFTPSGGRITLAAFAATDGVVIEVSDTGIGMSAERLESLAQPFALADASFTREGVGLGLGIPISRAIAELSGGRMAIDSSPALGTTVAFSLPQRPAEGVAITQNQAAA
ncbi:sensor histidine kinase [Devosia nitrariae]|uniref:histidine kinase n=1 Tax=Devosia nitrariae TaxID=2071872 RepID=A0ABQ5W568_9HYPH|nr:PAS domain-containing sensor histidine kinase [Devosia nitrariae]GLQ55071.1 hypothetical protein GCM10010862_23300 [Devosia nitrariae]